MPGDDDGKKTGRMAEQLRGAARLLVEGTVQGSRVVQDMHVTIGGGPPLLGRPWSPVVKLVTAPVYSAIRGVAGLVGGGLDVLLQALEPVLSTLTPGPEYDAVRAALNGVLGDHLEATGNALALDAELRVGGRALPHDGDGIRGVVEAPARRLLVMVHGSSMDDAMFTRHRHNHGEALARALGFTVLTFRYNSGLHISRNGHLLDEHLEHLVGAWPVPVDQLCILGFSMGGLVTRSAVHVAHAQGRAWTRSLGALVFLGTPHHGAGLERAGNVLDVMLGISAYSAPLRRLAHIRSAGVTDLRHGAFLDEHVADKDRFALSMDPRSSCALPAGVPALALAGTTSGTPLDAPLTDPRDNHGLPGDGLVSVDSALGRHADAALDLHVPRAWQHVFHGVNHLGLLECGAATNVMETFLRSVLPAHA